MRIISDVLWRKVQTLREQTRKHYVRAADGRLLSKPESGVLSTHLLNGIARCGVCGGSLGFCRKGAGRESYYCVGRGVGSGCTNARGIPEADLDRAVVNALHDLISDEETTWALLTARADRWRAEQEVKSRADERPAIEREVERLEAAIARLTDAIEAGQPVGDRLKQRQAELDTLRVKLAEPETFDPDREQFEVELARWIEPLGWTGPVVSERDPHQTRSAMRHLGVDKIIVTPEADGGWSFAGVGDLARLVGRKGVSPPPPTPPPVARAARAQDRAQDRVAPATPAL